VTKAFVFKHLGSLRPADEGAEELFQRVAQGEVVEIELRRPRRIRHHRLFWALMNRVWENVAHDTYPTVDSLVLEVKIITGHYDRRDIEFEGKRYPVLTPKSIAFHAMDQDEFSAFFSRVCDWVIANILPGVTEEELRQEVEQMTGISGGR
jgi:hypothetical protein